MFSTSCHLFRDIFWRINVTHDANYLSGAKTCSLQLNWTRVCWRQFFKAEVLSLWAIWPWLRSCLSSFNFFLKHRYCKGLSWPIDVRGCIKLKMFSIKQVTVEWWIRIIFCNFQFEITRWSSELGEWVNGASAMWSI